MKWKVLTSGFAMCMVSGQQSAFTIYALAYAIETAGIFPRLSILTLWIGSIHHMAFQYRLGRLSCSKPLGASCADAT